MSRNEDPIEIGICVPDNCGRLIGKRLPAWRWQETLERGMPMPDFHLVTGLDNKPFGHLEVTGVHTGFRNGKLRPDPGTRFRVPGEPRSDYFIADAFDALDTAVDHAPRSILKRQLRRLEAAGLTLSMASELEFYLFDQPFSVLAEDDYRSLRPYHHRHGDNDLLIASMARPFLDQLADDLAAAGLSIDQVQGEGGPGQLEINIRPADPLKACDQHAIFKHVVKLRAFLASRSVTFMAKPIETSAGSGGHVHVCLMDRDGVPLLAENAVPQGPAAAFIAGVLAFTRDFAPMHLPYANSFRRLRLGAFTPMNSGWAWHNRSCLVRLTGHAESARLEFRLPGADANPYFVYAGLIGSGLAGLEAGLPLPAAIEGDASMADLPPLPRDLTEAFQAFQESTVVRETLTAPVHQHLTALTREEREHDRSHVTDWDRRRGFEAA